MMSVFEKQFENDTQNSFKSKETRKNCRKHKLLGIETSENSRTLINKEGSFRSRFSSTVFDCNSAKQVQPEIAGWRRAEKEDKKAIKQLRTLTGGVAHLIYQKKKIDELIDKCYFPIVQFDSKGNLISFTAYDSYPNLPSVPFLWNDWLSINYGVKEISVGNVLFIHYMVWHPEHEDKFLPLLLETLFSEFMCLKHIIIIKPPKAEVPEFYMSYFVPVLPVGLEKLDNNSIQLLLLCLRSSVIRRLFIRSALEEDFYEVMSNIFKNKTEEKEWKTLSIKDLTNYFYNKDRSTLICEFKGEVAGIMTLNLKIDLEVLNEKFELAPFNGLRKQDMMDKMESELGSETTAAPRKSCDNKPNTNQVMSSKVLFSPYWEMSLSKTKKNFSYDDISSSSRTFSYSSNISQYSILKLSTSIEENISVIASKVSSHVRTEHCLEIDDLKVVVKASASAEPHFFPPKFHGLLNAFIIDFFAIDSNALDKRLSSLDFLEAAFKTVPDRDYCILLIPTDSLSFPLLDFFVDFKQNISKKCTLEIFELEEYFLFQVTTNNYQTLVAGYEPQTKRVTPKSLSFLNEELYLCHRNSLSIISMYVRNTEEDDLEEINNFLRDVEEGDKVYKDILNNCFGQKTDFKSFILTLEEKIIGISLVNSQAHIKNFYMHFELTDLVPHPALFDTETSTVIKHLVICPIYRNYARFFLRDIMRLVDVTWLYYVDEKVCKRCNVLTVLGDFAPIRPKRKAGLNIQFSFSEEKSFVKPFSLCICNPRLCSIHKIHMNIVIVVVGASQTALSFFENLIFGSKSYFYNYNNLICVSPHGLDSEDDEVKDLMFPVRHNFTKKYLSMLSLETYVTFVYGTMTEINRTEKYIVVNNSSVIKYDYLILTCGLQYFLPFRAKDATKSSCKKKSALSSSFRFLRRNEEGIRSKHQKQLNNMFIINTSKDAQKALQSVQFLMQKLKKDGKKIIVYGHDLHVFLTIHTLLKLGIPGEFIVFVEPFPSSTTTITLFNDFSVDQAVIETVKECKVSYYTDYMLHDYSVSSEDYITSIQFHSRRKELIIPCLAFFPFLEKLVSDVTFNACNEARLVYDGRLVINHNFRTNDKYIYAAGSFTKYARRYYADEFSHQYYNSREVGQKLADIIQEKTNAAEKDKSEKESELVPRLTAPVFFYCQLPGDFNLFMLRKPGKELDLETAYNFSDYGEVLTTGDCSMKNGGYFRLHLNPEGFVESITCYTKNKIDYVNLSSLYGLHERILNNLLFRYDMAVISNFYEYFRQPWALALFHDHFQRLRERNHKAFFQKTSNGKIFCERVIEELKANKWLSLPKSVKQQLESEYLNSVIQEDIRYNLIQFLEFYRREMPIYATPFAIKSSLKDNSKR